ncbi:polysaccharide pyruvyl transferase family protein [Novosphingobium resinovorum]|uniref:polysaccharide pyruvyl transferase family protein n=1 Tax=Novosphingobium resinovorum TaxID=158500 RepID=UPI002ED5C349
MVYLDYAFTTNVGDQLIVLGTLKFFERHGITIKLARNIHNVEDAGPAVAPGDVLVFHGGGNFGDIYPHFQQLRERIIAAFPENRVVIMPQTVHFDDKAELDRSCRAIASHPAITLFVRDRHSLAIVKPYFGERARLVPDIAHQLWPSLWEDVAQEAGNASSEPLLLLRRDAEQAAIPAAIAGREDRFTDWDVLISRRYRIERAIIRGQYGAARRGVRLYDLDQAYFAAMRREVIRVARGLYRHPLWITSRMHGAILGLLLGKPVFALDNSYGKLSSYFDAWGQWTAPVKLVTSPQEAAEMMEFVHKASVGDESMLWTAYRDRFGR